MRATGFSSPAGFQPSPGRIGRKTRLATSSPMWIQFWRGESHAARDPVRVGVAQQQHELEEDHAGGPDDGRAPEPGKDLLGEDGLDQEEQEGAQEDGGGVKQHRAFPLYFWTAWSAANGSTRPAGGRAPVVAILDRDACPNRPRGAPRGARGLDRAGRVARCRPARAGRPRRGGAGGASPGHHRRVLRARPALARSPRAPGERNSGSRRASSWWPTSGWPCSRTTSSGFPSSTRSCARIPRSRRRTRRP